LKHAKGDLSPVFLAGLQTVRACTQQTFEERRQGQRKNETTIILQSS
jgi:hypothetical protein